MKGNILFTIFLSLILGCTSDSSLDAQIEAIQPTCLQDIVKSILEEEVSNPKRSISAYTFNSEKVFVVTPSSFVSEPATMVLNSNCEIICLIGGIDGSANDCENFESAVFIETVWSDPR